MRFFRPRQLTPPSTFVFVVSLILAVLAVANMFFVVPLVGHYLRTHEFWVMTAAYALLAAGAISRSF